MIFNVGPSGLSPYPDFKFTVGSTDYTFDSTSQTSSVNNVYYFYRNGTNWEFYAKTNGTLKFNGSSKIDVFMLGNGSSGGAGSFNVSSQYYPPPNNYTLYWCSSVNGGSGGAGGTRKTNRGIIASGDYAVTIGSTSSFGTLKSNDTGYSQANQNGNGGYCFDDENAVGIDGNNYLVGAGGGRGGYTMTDGVTPSTTSPQNGGTTGGGKGGTSDAGSAGTGSAASCYGAGGGGGGAWGNSNQTYSESGHGGKANGGAGKAGFVAIRNAR